MATVQAKAHVNVLRPSPVELPIVVSKVHSEAVLNTGIHAHELKTKTELLEACSNNSWRSKTSSKIGKNMLEERRDTAPTIRWAEFFTSGKACVGTITNFNEAVYVWLPHHNTEPQESTKLLVHVLSTSKQRSWYPHRQDKTCQMRRSSAEHSIHTVTSSRNRKTYLLRQCHAQWSAPNQQLSPVMPTSCSEIV